MSKPPVGWLFQGSRIADAVCFALRTKGGETPANSGLTSLSTNIGGEGA